MARRGRGWAYRVPRCDSCRVNVGTIGYQGLRLCVRCHVHALEMDAVREALEERWADECNCVLPEQSCPACREAASRVFAPEFEMESVS